MTIFARISGRRFVFKIGDFITTWGHIIYRNDRIITHGENTVKKVF